MNRESSPFTPWSKTHHHADQGHDTNSLKIEHVYKDTNSNPQCFQWDYPLGHPLKEQAVVLPNSYHQERGTWLVGQLEFW